MIVSMPSTAGGSWQISHVPHDSCNGFFPQQKKVGDFKQGAGIEFLSLYSFMFMNSIHGSVAFFT